MRERRQPATLPAVGPQRGGRSPAAAIESGCKMQNKLIRALGLLSLACGLAWSQAVTGSISGSVTDKSGATVASARLTLVNIANGEQRTVRTNEAGQFVISSADPGEYSLMVQATGFKTLQRNGVILTPSEILSVGNLVLDLGTVEETVTVTAQGTTVQTASGERSEAITTSQTEELPVYGRVVTSLVAIEPGVVDPIGQAARSLAECLSPAEHHQHRDQEGSLITTTLSLRPHHRWTC
jgi:hypothetical protein